MVAEREQIAMDTAFAALRSYARNHNVRLVDVTAAADAVVMLDRAQTCNFAHWAPGRRGRSVGRLTCCAPALACAGFDKADGT